MLYFVVGTVQNRQQRKRYFITLRSIPSKHQFKIIKQISPNHQHFQPLTLLNRIHIRQPIPDCIEHSQPFRQGHQRQCISAAIEFLQRIYVLEVETGEVVAGEVESGESVVGEVGEGEFIEGVGVKV